MYHHRVVLDIQCFTNNANSYIIKEAAAIDIDYGILLFHHIASPPYDIRALSLEKQRENKWLTRNFHGLPWNSGDISYTDLFDRLRDLLKSCVTVFVKGLEKKEFIQSMSLGPRYCEVKDLTSLGCYSLNHLTETCTIDSLKCNHHKSPAHRCALANAVNLRKWYTLHSP